MRDVAEGSERPRQRTKKDSQLVFGEFILGIFAVSELYVILSGRYGVDTQKWACGVLGYILAAVLRLFR